MDHDWNMRRAIGKKTFMLFSNHYSRTNAIYLKKYKRKENIMTIKSDKENSNEIVVMMFFLTNLMI